MNLEKKVDLNKIIKIILYTPVIMLLLGCNSTEKFSCHNVSNTEITISKDSSDLDSSVFSNKCNLMYLQNDSSFSVSADSNIQHIIAKTKIASNNIVYIIDLNRHELNRKFNWQNEEDYTVVKMSIGIDDIFIDISELNFENISSRKVYPSGVWHWAVEDCSVKFLTTKDKEYFFINGANLYCNGSHCNGFQLYVIAKEDNKLVFSALEYYDYLPYYFHELKIFDKNLDGIPEFYLPIGPDNNNTNLNNFENYSFDLNNKVIKL